MNIHQGVCASLPEAGAQCGSSACLGSVRGVPGNRHSYRDQIEQNKGGKGSKQRAASRTYLVRVASFLKAFELFLVAVMMLVTNL
jgi:hypothetical protein